MWTPSLTPFAPPRNEKFPPRVLERGQKGGKEKDTHREKDRK